jgi:hypothetical protein
MRSTEDSLLFDDAALRVSGAVDAVATLAAPSDSLLRPLEAA